MKYDHGKKTTALPFELSPLEAAIDRFGHQAFQYHGDQRILGQVINETEQQRKERESKAKKEYKHFSHERRLALSIVDVQ